MSFISLLDQNQQWFLSKKGVEFYESPFEISCCQYITTHLVNLEIEDVLLDARFQNTFSTQSSERIRFYAGYPLQDATGKCIGTLSVMDILPRSLSHSQKCSLDLLSLNITSLINQKSQREDSEQFEKMYRLSPHLICIYRPAAQFLMLNPALCQLTGLEDNKFDWNIWKEIIHTQDRKNVQTALEAGYQENNEPEITVQVLSADGTYKWIEWVISIDKSTGHVFAMGRDVTDALEWSNKLQHTTQLLEETNKVARIGGWEIDVDSMELQWTSMTRELHGQSENYEPDIDTAIQFYKEVEVRKLIKSAIAEAIAFGTPWSFEAQIIDSRGNDVWVYAVGKAEMKDGKCYRLYGTFQDINDKKKVQLEHEQSQAILQAFVRHTPAAVAMFDRDMRYMAVSNTWLKDHSLTDNKVVGELHYDLSPFITTAGRERHQRILAGAVEQHAEDATFLEGSDFNGYSAWEMRPWYLPDDSIGGIMIFTQDVTHLVSQREQLDKARLEAEYASKAKTEFLANMSHELRTPLNGILGFANLALHTDTNDHRKQYLDLVVKSGQSLSQIINDILDYSQLESGMVNLVLERTDLHSLMKEAVAEIIPEARHKNLHINSYIPPDIHQFIWTDIVRIRQILNNILRNAVKFTEVGRVSLRVEKLHEHNEHATYRFSISDTGIGIHPTKQALVFEAFAQEDGSLTRKHGGTGLGLTISNKLLQIMNSTLKLQSIPNTGSVFHFDLHVRASHS